VIKKIQIPNQIGAAIEHYFIYKLFKSKQTLSNFTFLLKGSHCTNS